LSLLSQLPLLGAAAAGLIYPIIAAKSDADE
jgi:hypothetical protein